VRTWKTYDGHPEPAARSVALRDLARSLRALLQDEWLSFLWVAMHADEDHPEPEGDLVDAGDGCPQCGERRMDQLVMDDAGDGVLCIACGRRYHILLPLGAVPIETGPGEDAALSPEALALWERLGQPVALAAALGSTSYGLRVMVI
jgi:hypothetical protein